MAHDRVRVLGTSYIVSHDSAAIVLAIQEMTQVLQSVLKQVEDYGQRLDSECNKETGRATQGTRSEARHENTRSQAKKSRALKVPPPKKTR